MIGVDDLLGELRLQKLKYVVLPEKLVLEAWMPVLQRLDIFGHHRRKGCFVLVVGRDQDARKQHWQGQRRAASSTISADGASCGVSQFRCNASQSAFRSKFPRSMASVSGLPSAPRTVEMRILGLRAN